MPLSYAEISCDVFPVCKIYYIPFNVTENVITAEGQKNFRPCLKDGNYYVFLFLFGDLNGGLVCKLFYFDAVICAEIVLNTVNGVIGELHRECNLKA